MAVTSKSPGKLGLEIVSSVVANNPSQRNAIEEAWQVTSGRLCDKWTDPRLWLALFDETPADEKLLADLKKAAQVFYDHPADTSFTRALRRTLQAKGIFSPVTILKAVREYTETLSQELFLADPHFRETLRNAPDPLSMEVVKETAPLLLPEQPPVEPPQEAEVVPEVPSSAVEQPPQEPEIPPWADQAPAASEPEEAAGLSSAWLAMMEAEARPVQPAQEGDAQPADQAQTEETPPAGQVEEIDYQARLEEARAALGGEAPEPGLRSLLGAEGPAIQAEPAAPPEQPESALPPSEEIPILANLYMTDVTPEAPPMEAAPAEEIRALLASEPEKVPPAKKARGSGAWQAFVFAFRRILRIGQPSIKRPSPAPLEPEVEHLAESELLAEAVEPQAESIPVIPSPLQESLTQAEVSSIEPEAESIPVSQPSVEETPSQAEAATSELEPEEVGEAEPPPERLKPYTRWITAEPTTEALLHIQQPAEELNGTGEPVPTEPGPQELAESEIPALQAEEQSETLPLAPESVEPAPILAEAVPQESKSEELIGIETAPAELQLRDEFASAEAEAAKVKESSASLFSRIGVLLSKLARIFSRPEKIPPIPAGPEEAPVPAGPPVAGIQAEELQPAPVEILPQLAPLVEAQPVVSVEIPPQASKKPGPRKILRPAGRRAAAGFVGRVGELQQLADWLGNSRQPVVIGQSAALDAMGGLGKTRLAQEYVDRYGREYPGGLFWIHCADPRLLPHKIAAFSAGPKGRSLDVRAKQVLSEWQKDAARLIVFDECDDPALLKDWLPAQGNSRVLITTRLNQWDGAVPVHFLALGPFRRPESLALLQGLCSGIDLEAVELDDLAAELGDLPLALRMAAGDLAVSGLGIPAEAYLQSLRAVGPAQLPQPKGNKVPAVSYDLHARQALKGILDRFDPHSPADQSCLKVLQWMASCAPGEMVPTEFLQRIPNEKTASMEAAVEWLSSLGLVDRDRDKAGGIKIHPMTAGFVQELLPGQEEVHQVERAILAAAKEADQASRADSTWPLLPHLKHITDRALNTKMDETAAGLSTELGASLETAGDYPGALYYFEKTLTINQKAHRQVHPDTAVNLTILGNLLCKTGNYKAARAAYQQALNIRRKFFGSEHSETARSLNDVGHALQSLGKYRQAFPYYERALFIRRNVFGEKHPDSAASLNNLGNLSLLRGDQAAAHTYLRQALSIRREVLGEEHADTAASLHDLGCYFKAVGEYATAKTYLERALAIRRKVLGEEHPDTAQSLSSLGELMLAREKHKEAFTYFEWALSVQKAMLGEESLQTAATYAYLGSILQALGDYPAARSAMEKAQAIRTKLQGKYHPDVTAGRIQMGKMSRLSRQPRQAPAPLQPAAEAAASSESKRRWLPILLGPAGRTVIASLFVLAVVILGWNLFIRGGAPLRMNWNLSGGDSNPLLQPLKLFGKNTPTPTLTTTNTSTSTPRPTFTPTKTRTATLTRTWTPSATPTATSTLTATPTNTKRILIDWTPSFTRTKKPEAPVPPTNTPRPADTPTPRPPDTPTPRPPDTSTPVPPPTDTPIPPTSTPPPPPAP